MSHFAYTRTPGTWTALSALTHAEMSDIDVKTYKAINGDEGGAWTPSSAIQVGGAGFSFGGATGHRVISGSALYVDSGAAFQASSGATFTLDNGVTVSVQAAFVAGGGGTLTGTWSLGGATNITSAGTLTIKSGGNFTSAVGSNVVILFDQNTSGFALQNSAYANWYTGTTATFDAGSTLTVNGTTVLAGAVTLSGAMACSEPITLSSNGTIKWRCGIGGNADVTYLADTIDEVFVDGATLSSPRTYTLAGTAVEGQRFRITSLEGTHRITFNYNGGGSTANIRADGTDFRHFEITYISGSWRRTLSVVT